MIWPQDRAGLLFRLISHVSVLRGVREARGFIVAGTDVCSGTVHLCSKCRFLHTHGDNLGSFHVTCLQPEHTPGTPEGAILTVRMKKRKSADRREVHQSSPRGGASASVHSDRKGKVAAERSHLSCISFLRLWQDPEPCEKLSCSASAIVGEWPTLACVKG